MSRTLRRKPQPVGPRPPWPRAVTRWLLTHPDALVGSDRIQLQAVLAYSSGLDVLTKHARAFAHMATDLLPARIESARASTDLPSLSRFAHHLERDVEAVVAGLSRPWNSGVVEGHVNRIKVLKRQMFDRARFEFLRKRVLLAK
ncbi:transposase [Streptomyces mirabilis]|uniref:transposase n=1 Tax=Streptomyces mirabilis TaxID=68239 RepID=UPI0033B862BB